MDAGAVPLWRHPEWAERFPWLVQATTGRGSVGGGFDLGLFGMSPAGPTVERWRQLRSAVGMLSVLHSHQVHGAKAASWDDPVPPGLCVVEGLDAHVTGRPGLLLAVSVADCVPIFLVAEKPRIVGVVHAGWRGVAAGVLEATLALFERRGTHPGGIRLHAGPSICGLCYEVGPEVHAAVNTDRPPPDAPIPIDLRAAIAARAQSLGIPGHGISISEHCTRCGPADFFSHRGGDPGRQMGLLGILE